MVPVSIGMLVPVLLFFGLTVIGGGIMSQIAVANRGGSNS